MIMRRFYRPCHNSLMCGRYSLHSHPEVVALLFGLSEVPAYQPRYNIAPTAQVLIVRKNGAAMVKWGLVPHWAKDPSGGARLNNARAETVAEKPAFREAYRQRRCLIPANGFYEWKLEHGAKQPYYVYPSGGALFAFAGLWEQWNDPHLSPNLPLETCTIITTEANQKMAAVHDRMPVIVSPAEYSAWLSGATYRGVALLPCPDSAIDIRRVGRAVNNARNEDPRLIEPDEG
jgi:putative SOS response-associated peptidase YedK